MRRSPIGMTYIKELPTCVARFGRTDIIEIEEDGIIKKVVKILLVCGYREVDPEECICCGGFANVRIKLNIDSFLRLNRRL